MNADTFSAAGAGHSAKRSTRPSRAFSLLPSALPSLPSFLHVPVAVVWHVLVAAVAAAAVVAAWAIARSGQPGLGEIACLLEQIACLAAAILLKRTRRESPVSLLLSFAFIGLAALFAPFPEESAWEPFRFAGLSLFIALFVACLPAFPDGRFVPASARISLWLGPVVGMLLLLPSGALSLTIFVSVAAVIGAAAMFVYRYRATTDTTLKQQMRWAAIGLGGGTLLALAGIAVTVMAEAANSLVFLALGVAATLLGALLLPAGLIVALACYRLNDVDAVLTRVSAYTILALLVALVWAGGGSILNKVISESAPAYTASVINALIAVAVLAPSKERVLSLMERRFQKALVEMRSLPSRLASWQHDDDSAELARVTLAAVTAGVNAEWAALTLEDGSLVHIYPSRAEQPESPSLTIELKAGESAAGHLLLGERTDGWSYNKTERDALNALAEPLGCALYVTSRRARRTAQVFESLEALRAGLEQLHRRVQ